MDSESTEEKTRPTWLKSETDDLLHPFVEWRGTTCPLFPLGESGGGYKNMPFLNVRGLSSLSERLWESGNTKVTIWDSIYCRPRYIWRDVVFWRSENLRESLFEWVMAHMRMRYVTYGWGLLHEKESCPTWLSHLWTPRSTCGVT